MDTDTVNSFPISSVRPLYPNALARITCSRRSTSLSALVALETRRIILMLYRIRPVVILSLACDDRDDQAPVGAGAASSSRV